MLVQPTLSNCDEFNYDDVDHCLHCHQSHVANRRIEQLITAGKAEPRCARSECGHVVWYESVGLWTAQLRRIRGRRR